MSATKPLEILATGPYFMDPNHASAQQRVMLTKVKDSHVAAGRFVVRIERRATVEKPSMKVVKRVRVRQFTHAVRIFCDCMLELALAADREEQRRAG
jgi:hypothetical protein